MFGVYRFTLASLVLLTHLWPSAYHHAGLYAVFSFYMLSGYLMTFIMNEKYGFKNKGITKYLVNRALRIYPTYLICMGLTAALVYAFPWLTWQLSRSVTMPGSLHQWFSNIFIIGLDGFTRGRFVPQAWSLYVEIIFYLLIGLVLARKKAFVVTWLIFGIISTMYLSGGEVRDTVFSITAGSLPFSLGATVYYFKDEFGTARPAFLIIAVVLYLLNISNLAGSVHESGMYLSLYLSFLLLIVLKDLKIPSLKKIDNLLGDLSYPMYVSHFLAGLLVLWAFFPNVPRHRGVDFFILAYGYTLIISYVLHVSVEKRINSIRERVKQ